MMFGVRIPCFNLSLAAIAACNEYLRDMAVAGYAPVPETLEEIVMRYMLVGAS